ncbi:acetylglucosamine-6-sulfatase [Echinicola pacifica]|uniref:Acetylglucosamine-6-sulfatase n=1 Tax=Echinicola pacifica TaxID=346377 RepID=A0A918PVN5_9BACT|nr:sulfatase [Echinicola pacifica]GGZ24519.1 acetylglucosamine-6-sulfatase [Echinicola pacifica]
MNYKQQDSRRGTFRNWAMVMLLGMGLVACSKAPEDSAPKRPNIIYIMADDHTSQAFGVYGSRLADLNPTPTLDSLARSGMIFDNCFVNNAICVPSRAAILTGQHAQANGVIDLEGELPGERQYLPQELKKLGYQTAIIGKWHLGQEPSAFDYYKVLDKQGTYFDPVFRVRGDQPWPNNTEQYEGHSSDVITDQVLDWFQHTKKDDEPYFLMFHYKAPHDDFENAPRYESYLEDTFIPEPASLYDNGNNGSVATRGNNDTLTRIIGSSVSHRNLIRHQSMNIWQDENYKKYRNAEDIQDSELVKWEMDEAEKAYTSEVYQSYLKKYLRCVKGVDDNVKRFLAYLKENGMLENTIIVYTSDQGFMLGEHDYIDKRWMYDESMRMPFFIRYPEKIEAGTRTDAIINNTDFAPTLISLAGGKVPEYMQGHNFTSILETNVEPEDWQKSTYYRYWMHLAHRHGNPAHFGLRTKDYKLIFYYGRYWVDTDDPNADWNKESWGNDYTRHTPVAWEFYDLNEDPQEMDNRYGDPAYAGKIAELKEQLILKREELNETDENYPHIQKIIEQHWND